MTDPSNANRVALWAGLAAAGVDVARLQPPPDAPQRAAVERSWRDVWALARDGAARTELAVEAGLAVPFGLFGMVDYLAGSALNLRGGLRALTDHFAAVTDGLRLVFEESAAQGSLRVVPGAGRTCDDAEFTLAVTWGRFRALATRPIVPAEMATTRAQPDPPSRHAALVGAPVRFAAEVSRLAWYAADLDVPLRSSDPGLHRTLTHLAAQLGLGADGTELERAVRSRLRALLPDGRSEAAHVARALGMSERTLHRRLGAEGRTYRSVVDAFRAAESERLLRAGTTSLAAIALALGFSDQTAWTRAFRRWRGVSPTTWRARHVAAGGRR